MTSEDFPQHLLVGISLPDLHGLLHDVSNIVEFFQVRQTRHIELVNPII